MLDATSQVVPNTTQRGLAAAYDRCSVPSGSRPAWCVVATLPRAERRAHANLHRFGLETYLPLVTVRWANRTWHTIPLFQGYCFVRLDLARPWSPIRYAPGVFDLVMVEGLPARCPDHALEAVRSAVDGADAMAAAEPPWKPGTPCTLLSGPLASMPAVVTEVHGPNAQIAIMMLGHLRQISVPLDCLRARDDLEPIGG